ncbi:MAG TPA: ABC transporter permease [Cyclobacteriaceae bacterium]
MLFNYLKIAVRNFGRQSYYSLINMVGLALGIAACILILLFVKDELSYETSFENHETIYRLTEDFPMGTHISRSATVPFPVKQKLMEDFPQITNAVIIFRPSSWGNSPILKLEDVEYYEDDFVFAEQDLFNIYDLEFIKGTRENALVGPNKLVLTESAATKYFGEDDPIGKRLRLNDFVDLEVTGVIRDLPNNTHLKFDMIGSFETFKSFFNDQTFFETQWVWVAAWLYFTVEDPKDVEQIRAGLPAFIKKHYPENLTGTGVALTIQKADDVHLTSSIELEFDANGNIQHVYLFSAIALLVLFIAVINFMNLATSRSAKRAREVGMRKVMGAYRNMLVGQFMGEAVMTSMLSLVLAVGMIAAVLPWFNDLTGKSITLSSLAEPQLIAGIIAIGLLAGLLAGSYPSFILSSFKPTEVLKGKAGATSHANFLRKSLVVAQFVVSISLIICIGIVHRQLNYIQSKDLGIAKDQVMMVDATFNQVPGLNAFKSELLKSHNIEAVATLGGSIPGEEEVIENSFIPEGAPDEDQQWFSVMFVGHDFEKVLDLEILQGHAFQPGNAVDSTGFIINEAAARALGWGDDVVGRTLKRSLGGNNNQEGVVIGLVKDFHYRPLYDVIKPLVIMMGGNQLAVRMSGANAREAVDFVAEEWSKHFEGVPFRYSFVDENFDKLYRKEDKFGKTIQVFSILTIFIACLGLLGLSSFTAESRRKEIGIRKVNGASSLGLVALLAKEFSLLVLIAFAIAVPLSWYMGSLWLGNFAYRTDISVSLFIWAGIAALLIAFVTVSYHTFKAAMTNPEESLRYE